MQNRGLAVLAAIFTWMAFTAVAADAQTKKSVEAKKPIDGADVAAGRALALEACTGCHIVAADQPYRPIYKGAIHPPDFKDIANKADASAASLRAYLSSLPAIPKNGQMANTDLTEQELREVSAFIMTLRDTSSLRSSSSSR